MTNTNFFTEVLALGLTQLSIEIRVSEDGSMTVFVTPKSEKAGKEDAFKAILPFTLTGKPEELDADFFGLITEPMQEVSGIISNIEAFKAQAKEAQKMASENAKKKSEGDAKAKETAEAKPVAAPKLSKEEKAKADKIEKALKSVNDIIALITDSESFTSHKDKLSKEIMILGVATGKEGTDYQTAKEFFDKNNNEEGLFTASDTAVDTTEVVEVEATAPAPEAPMTDVKVVIETEVRTAPAPMEIVQDKTEEHLAEFEAEEVAEIVEEAELNGNSLADMQTERTQERYSQLNSLGLEETDNVYVGHGFEVKHFTVVNHPAEYWDELIKGIQSVVNKETIVAAPVPEISQILEARTNRLLELGMKSDGEMNLVGYTFTVHISQLRNDTDEEFEKLFANIQGAVKTPPAAKIEEPRFEFTEKATHSLEAYINAGWNKAQLVQQGLGRFIETAAPAPEPTASLLGSDDDNLIQ